MNKVIKALGHNVVILEEASKKVHHLGAVDLTVPDVFQSKNRRAEVVSIGSLVTDIKEGDKVYLRAQATVGSEVEVNGVNYGIVDQAEVLCVFL